MAPRKNMSRRNQKAPPAVKQYVKRAIESKRDTITACADTTVNIGYNSPLIYDMTPLGAKSQGQDVDFVSLKSNISLQMASPANGFVRVLAIQWFADNSDALPTLADIFCGESGSVTSYYEGYNQSLVHQKFVVIKDKLVTISQAKSDGLHYMRLNISKKQVQRTVFRSTGAGNYKNQIYLVILSNHPVATTPTVVKAGHTFQFKNRD